MILTTMTIALAMAPMKAVIPTSTSRTEDAVKGKTFQTGQWGTQVILEVGPTSSQINLSLQVLGHVEELLVGTSTAVE